MTEYDTMTFYQELAYAVRYAINQAHHYFERRIYQNDSN